MAPIELMRRCIVSSGTSRGHAGPAGFYQAIGGGTIRAEDKAAASRAGVHTRMDQLVDRVGDVEASVTSIGAEVAEMKPVTDDVKRWKLMGIGALGVTGIAAMALGVSFAETIRRIVFVIIGKV